jgi:hypothetical protein
MIQKTASSDAVFFYTPVICDATSPIHFGDFIVIVNIVNNICIIFVSHRIFL